MFTDWVSGYHKSCYFHTFNQGISCPGSPFLSVFHGYGTRCECFQLSVNLGVESQSLKHEVGRDCISSIWILSYPSFGKRIASVDHHHRERFASAADHRFLVFYHVQVYLYTQYGSCKPQHDQAHLGTYAWWPLYSSFRRGQPLGHEWNLDCHGV